MRAITPTVLADLTAQAAVTRRQMWQRMNSTTGNEMVVLDIDASLVEIHTENKAGTGPNYKGGFGFGPMFCFADATGESSRQLNRRSLPPDDAGHP
jgi:hypothetical protein